MAFYLEIIEGPHAGQTFLARDGIEIGRLRGQIQLKKDTKVSSFHAAIELDERGVLVIVDQGSSNGIKINAQRVKRVTLLHGMTFQIGRSVFRVNEQPDVVEPGDQPHPILEKTWGEILTEEIPQLKLEKSVPKVSVRPFKNMLRLDFVEGLQADDYLSLGFGPRDFGSDNLDIEIKEPLAPATAFSIAPSGDMAVLTTDFPRLVKVDGVSDTRHDLRQGSRITIGTTLIVVSFEK